MPFTYDLTGSVLSYAGLDRMIKNKQKTCILVTAGDSRLNKRKGRRNRLKLWGSNCVSATHNHTPRILCRQSWRGTRLQNVYLLCIRTYICVNMQTKHRHTFTRAVAKVCSYSGKKKKKNDLCLLLHQSPFPTFIKSPQARLKTPQDLRPTVHPSQCLSSISKWFKSYGLTGIK